MAICFAVGPILINQQNTNSTVAIGENQFPGLTGHRKVNNGALQLGYTINLASGAIVIDQDVIDAQITNLTTNPSIQSQAL